MGMLLSTRDWLKIGSQTQSLKKVFPPENKWPLIFVIVKLDKGNPKAYNQRNIELVLAKVSDSPCVTHRQKKIINPIQAIQKQKQNCNEIQMHSRKF